MDFDQYVDGYQEAVDNAAGVSLAGLAGEHARLILEVLAGWLDDPKELRVLDVGCGIGRTDRALESGVGELYGADLSLQSLDAARAIASATRFVRYDGARLPFADASFDAAFAISVLHHVPPAERSSFITEMLRPIRPNGAVIVIEHNPLNPITQRIVSRCAFDADAILLSSRETAKLLANGGAPALGRRYLGFWPFRHALVVRAERAIAWLPMGAQYCMWGIKSA